MKKKCLASILVVLAIVFLATFVFAGSQSLVINSAPGGAGSWVTPISSTHKNPSGFLNVSVYGTAWVGTVWLQRSFQSGAWYDVISYDENIQRALVDREGGVRYRIGIKAGGYTSGSVAVRLSN